MKTKLFISNAEIVDQAFRDFCDARNIAITAKSLISFKALEFETVEETDVVFFSSPRTVDFFIESIKNKSTLLACLGSGTSKRLQEYGFTADFVGSVSALPEVVAAEFQEWLGDKKVLFPLSAISNRSISSVIPVDQKTELTVYETIAVSEKLEPFDIYVFTSPSNVDSFLKENEIAPDSRVIAWGKTTESKFHNLHIPCEMTLKNSSLRELETVLEK